MTAGEDGHLAVWGAMKKKPLVIVSSNLLEPVFANPDPAFHFDAHPDPDRAPHQSYPNANNGPHALHGSILSLHDSIVSVQGSPYLHFEPLQLMCFCFDADPDSTFD